MGYTYKKFKNKLTLLSYEGDEEIVKVPNEIDGYTVNKVASMCFFDLENVKEIHFPEGISIENNAIVYCCNLEKIYISSAVKVGNFIEDCCNAEIITNSSNTFKKIQRSNLEGAVMDLSIFSYIEKSDGTLKLTEIKGLKKLKDIIIPNSINGKIINELENCLFSDIYLDSFTFNDYIKEIPYECFRNSFINELKNIDNIEIVGPEAFYNCTVKNPLHFENLRVVKEFAFYLFSNPISIGNKLEKIDKRGFKSSQLAEISLENLKEELQPRIFENCSNLKSIYLPKNVEVLPEYFFYGCTHLEEIVGLKNITIFKQSCLRYCSNLTETINFKKVNIIEEYAFYGSNLQKTIRIGNCNVAERAFMNVTGTENIIFDDTYVKESIPNSCFRDSKIQKVTLNNSIKKLEKNCFYHCENLKSINLENIEFIGADALRFTNIRNLSLDSLKEISTGCFGYMKKLSFLDLSKTSLKEIPNRTFEDCKKLKEIVFPNSLESIDSYAFCNSGLQKLELPNNLKTIQSYFICGTKIKEITIPESIKVIKSSMFAGIDKNTTIKILAKDISFEEEAFRGIVLKNLDLSYIKMTEVKESMFAYCNIDNLKLPDTIVDIRKQAFYSANIKNLEMHTDKVENIEQMAFCFAKINNFSIIETAKTYGIGCYQHSVLKKKEIVLTNVTYIDKEAFYNVNMNKFTIKGNPDIKVGNFERGTVCKVFAEKKVCNKLKSRVYFKMNRFIVEEIK